MHTNENHPVDDFEVEFIDISTEELTQPGRRSKKRITTRNRNITFSALLLLFLIVFVLVSLPSLPGNILSFIPSFISHTTVQKTSGLGRLPPSTQITTNSSAQIINEGGYKSDGSQVQPEPMPTSCLSGSTLSSMGDLAKYPLWITGLDGPGANIHLEPIDSARHILPGWIITLYVKYVVPITLTISNPANGPQPGFLVEQSQTFSPTITLATSPNRNLAGNSQHPSIKQAAGRNIRILLPGTGCYLLSASWLQSHREITFAAGG